MVGCRLLTVQLVCFCDAQLFDAARFGEPSVERKRNWLRFLLVCVTVLFAECVPFFPLITGLSGKL